MTDCELLSVDYLLSCAAEEDPAEKARGIALEQTVELPGRAISPAVRERVVGRVDPPRPLGGGRWTVRIDYPLAAIGGELTQLLNLLFGNVSLKDGIRLQGVRWPASLLRELGGPGHGIAGLRRLTAAEGRPLLCTALKPMGSSVAELAEHAYHFALGGIDLIKDDHGLANQPDAPFQARLQACAAAVARANAETGGNSLYLPHVTAGYAELPRRLEAAREVGCRAVLLNPWVTGLDAMRWARDQYGLAIMAHPALTGSYFRSEHGLSPELMLGDLFRLAGADAVIYPNVGGRFGFDAATCAAINDRLRRPLGGLAPAFPTPGGGMDVARAGHWVERYGNDTILLIGGSLYARGDLTAASRALRAAIEPGA